MRDLAMAPFSKYKVGAAVLIETGEIVGGCNIENRGWSKIKIGFISGNGDNPLKRVVYFKKNEDPHYLEEYTSFMAPKNYQEYIYRIYINDSRHFANAKSIWLHTI